MAVMLLLLILFVGCPPPSPVNQCTASEEEIRDAILGKSAVNVATMDCNEDGQVDVADLVYLLTPMATFGSFASETEEGATNNVLVRVNFVPEFSGKLNYNVSGTATGGSDYGPLAGSIEVNGKYVDIPITITDDREVEEIETITLTFDENSEYFPFAPTEHTVYVKDNDAIWRGTLAIPLANTGITVDFRMKITQQDGVVEGALVTEGIGIIPRNPADSPDTTTTWPVTMTLDETMFSATVTGLPIPAMNTVKPGKLIFPAMTRKFEFTANEEDENQQVEPNFIQGTFTETVECASAPQLAYATNGAFFLQRRIAVVDLSEYAQ
jgi:hypothetical protein